MLVLITEKDFDCSYENFSPEDQRFAEVPQNVRKYINRRRFLFSRFDEGIQLDEESWYSVVAESIAKDVAAQLLASYGEDRHLKIIDGFCGAGGLSIQLATIFQHIISIELDPVKTKYLMNNAKIYGVDKNIDVICSDFLLLRPLQADVIFLLPPWVNINININRSFIFCKI